MIIDAYSDMHLDVWKTFLGRSVQPEDFHVSEPENVDVVVLAGDQGNGLSWTDYAEKLMRSIYPKATLVTVLGNHDHYQAPHSQDPVEIIDRFLETGKKALYEFHNYGISIAAATLWTEFRGDVGFGRIASRCINDFVRIPALRQSSEPWQILMQRFRQEAAWLKKAQADVVVTHFPPFLESVHPKFAGDQLNPYFVNDMEAYVMEEFPVKPKLWIHGHTHSTFDYQIGTIRVVSNPIGYPGENQEIPFRPKRITL